MKKIVFIITAVICCMALCTVAFATENVVYVSDGGTGNGATAETPVGTLGDAYAVLGESGGTIVVVGKVSVSDHFVEPSHSGMVTVTQVYGTNDYRTGDITALILHRTAIF